MLCPKKYEFFCTAPNHYTVSFTQRNLAIFEKHLINFLTF